MAIQIKLVADGIDVWNYPHPPHDFHVVWDDIDEIKTYKLDLVVYDTICLAFHTPHGWVEFNEDQSGFGAVFRELETRWPDIPSDWYTTAMHPAFQINERTLWKRIESAS